MKRTLNFGDERTLALMYELERMFSPNFQVWGMLSKTEYAWHASYVCTLQFNWQTLQTVERTKFNHRLADAVDSFLRLPSPTTNFFCNIRWSGCIMLVCSMLRVDLWYCACMHACLFYAASRSTVLYTYACTPSQSMLGGHSREFSVIACCWTAHLLQRRM